MHSISKHRPSMECAYTLRHENSQEFRWVQIVPIENWPEYGAGEDGIIYRLRDRKDTPIKPRAVKGWQGSSGYTQMYLARPGIRSVQLVHRLIAKAWLPNPDNLPEVGHGDEDKLNCQVSNLSWQSRAENIAHSKKNFLVAVEKRKTWTGVKDHILKLRAENKTLAQISKELKVSLRYVSKVCGGKTVEISENFATGDAT